MNDINLIPDKILYKNERLTRFFFHTLLYIIIAAAVICVLLFIPYRRWVWEGRVDEINLSINQKALSELDKAEAALRQKQQENSSVSTIYDSIPKGEIKATELFAKLAGLMPASINTVNFNYEMEKDMLVANLRSSKRSDIVLFLKRLYNEPIFKDINISDISGQSNEYMFTVMLKLTKDK